MEDTSLRIASFSSDRLDGPDKYTRDFKYPHNQKSAGVKSGNRGGHGYLQRLLMILSSPNVCIRNALTGEGPLRKMLPSVRYLLAKVHGTIAICMRTAGGFDEEYCGQIMEVSPIVWQLHEHCWSPEAASDAIASISTAMQGTRASFKHGRPARARSSNFPVSSNV
ncbi:hypothetical protein TNCV_832811 [Trichonephila clavipes]|uniref:Uncharacterized protein n=1 Tax=Trichonephila clavipes TaxID=2585209 RepID=A0A8X6UQN1_TRICX|nr:hypothetical protein TNCV_832811 [Trichonephila clavipes]